ncbi:WD40 repeat-like protein [Neoconidiobolus thromboides FSU 785]|nr:WD40 repeat-like protein [Neoconidiobolus thromboides FSU 785]
MVNSYSKSSNNIVNIDYREDYKFTDKFSDTISDLQWSPSGPYLSVASWDKTVKIYEVSQAAKLQARPLMMYEHEAPVMCSSFTLDGQQMVSGGGDNQVVRFDLKSGNKAIVGTHDAPISCIGWINSSQILVTGSWDKTIKYWDLRQNRAVSTVALSDRVYCMSTSGDLLVAGLADKSISIVNLQNPQAVLSNAPSEALRQVKCISAYSSPRLGYFYGTASGAIYEKVVEPNKMGISNNGDRANKKAHMRSTSYSYSVNKMCIHPSQQYLCSGGSDGKINIWSRESFVRLSYFDFKDNPVTALNFDSSGQILAYATGYEWKKGYQYHKNITPALALHKMKEIDLPKNRN